MESSLDHPFHDRDIPDILEQTIHLHHIFQVQSHQGQPLFHFIKGALDLLLDRAAYIADAVIDEAIVPRLNDSRMCPLLIHIISSDFSHFTVLLTHIPSVFLCRSLECAPLSPTARRSWPCFQRKESPHTKKSHAPVRKKKTQNHHSQIPV